MANLFQDSLTKPLCGDGALGTYLQSLDPLSSPCVEELNLTRPELVERVHREYINAGARIIETNSFQANQVFLTRYGLANDVEKICRASVEIARRAVEGVDGVYIAASVGPIGKSTWNADFVRQAREQQIAWLGACGVDAFFLETRTDLNEALETLEICKCLFPSIPAAVLFAPSEEGRLYGGISLERAFSESIEKGADCVGVNASLGPSSALRVLAEIPEKISVPVAAYPNAGKPQYLDGHYLFYATPDYFVQKSLEMLEAGVRVFGGCIGTTPEHIRALSKVLPDSVPSPASVRVKSSRSTLDVNQPVSQQQSDQKQTFLRSKGRGLLEVYARGNAVIVELDTPKTLALEKYFEAAHSLARAGAHKISLADNALAIMRNSNLAVGGMMVARGLSPLIHIACRDKNVIALQSELMGLHSLGIDHLLVITGDPAKVGDHPDASSVYDMNSIGLIKLAASFNQGFSLSGRDLKGKTNFVIGCSFNPNANNLDNQLRKLESKLKAGAHYVMTQPVFDVRLVERCAKPLASFGIPVFIGVMPLISDKNAEFLHNEVPGISIPEEVRASLRGLERDQAREVSLKIATEIRDAVLEHFSGIYLITPGLRVDLVEPLIPQNKFQSE